MSNNAKPFPMVKIDDIAPHNIPGASRILGPFRTEFFIGQLSGHHWELTSVPSCPSYPQPCVVGPDISPQPFIWGDKVSFQPTPNFEFGMGVTAMFGGPGLPVTFGNFFKTFYVHGTSLGHPGKRISAADFTYRLPYLRNWLTLYLDSLVVDEVSPIGSTRANVNPGIYMPQLPGLPKMELRAEGINESRRKEFSPGFVYSDNDRYRSGYTLDGNILGNAIGRAGRGVQGWTTYWVAPRNKLDFHYRLQTVSPAFIGGGRLEDFSAKSEWMIGANVSFSGLLQYEKWRFPVLSPMKESNFTTSVQLTFYPHVRTRQSESE